MKPTRLFILPLSVLFLISLCAYKAIENPLIRDDFKKYYDQYELNGSFVLYDQAKNQYTFYNPKKFEVAYTPASTFKICSSLIGVETGIIPDENFVIPWDSVVRHNAPWNKDHDLKTAYKNSTVWYYQELARRVGKERMQYWLDTCQYGNGDISGGIDQFWLNGSLRITPKQQIDFLKRLHNNQLPFSKRTVEIVKKIMVAKDTLGCVLRAKTGWAGNDTRDFGWYVGYLETKDNVYFFANCVETNDLKNQNFGKARSEIVYDILDELKLLPKQ